MALAPAPALSASDTVAGPADATHPQGTLSDEQKAAADSAFAELDKEGDMTAWAWKLAHVPAIYHEYWLVTHPNPNAPVTAPTTP